MPAVSWLRKNYLKLLPLPLVLLGLTVFLLLFRKDSTWEEILKRGSIAVCLDPSYPPFEYTDEATGELRGFDVEMAKAIGDYLGLKVEILTVGFDGLYDAVKGRKCDVAISALPYDPLLTQDVAFSISYFEAGLMLVVKEGEENIHSPDDLKGKKVAVEWGSTGDVEARRLKIKLGELEIKPYPTVEEALRAVKEGQADACLADAVSAYSYWGREGGVKVIAPALISTPYVAVVNIKNKALLGKINEALFHLRKTGYLHSLAEKYFGVRPANLWP